MTKTRQDNNIIDRISLVYSDIEIEHRDLSDWVRFVMNTKQDNDLTDHTSTVYTANETKLSWSIRLGAIYNENLIGQRPNRSYKYNLR